MKNKKGFTLIELLAVIVILGIIMTIATTNVLKSIKQSKIRSRYIAAKDITEIAKAYLETNNKVCVSVEKLISEGFLNSDVTNPANEDAKNISSNSDMSSQFVCKSSSYKEQSSYDLNNNVYAFDGYCYSIGSRCFAYDKDYIFRNAEFTKAPGSGRESRYYFKEDAIWSGETKYIKILVENANAATLRIKLPDKDYVEYNSISFETETCKNSPSITGKYTFKVNDQAPVEKINEIKDGNNKEKKCKEEDFDIPVRQKARDNYLTITVTHNGVNDFSVWLYLKKITLK